MGQTFDVLAKAGVIHENLAMQLKKAVEVVARLLGSVESGAYQ